MKSYQDPGFEDRVGRAKAAKQKALDQLRAKPPLDPAQVAERQAAQAAREVADATRREEKKAAKQAAAVTKPDKDASEQAAAVAERTEAELKAARDARYAARKNRS
jgi:uncharacterized membrane protein YqiK